MNPTTQTSFFRVFHRRKRQDSLEFWMKQSLRPPPAGGGITAERNRHREFAVVRRLLITGPVERGAIHPSPWPLPADRGRFNL